MSSSENLQDGDEYVVDYTFAQGPTAEIAKRYCPVGYTLCDVDLNKKTDKTGDYLYLCFKRGREIEPYTAFCMEDSADRIPPGPRQLTHQGKTSQYDRHKQDLNSTVGGKYIYMSGTKDKFFKPIKQLEVIYDNPQPSAGWEVICWVGTNEPADCNKKAGGKYVYIRVRR